MLRFTVCVVGIYTCFLTWGIVQERVSTTPYGNENAPNKFKFFIVLNLVQSLIASLVAYFYMRATRRQIHLQSTPYDLYLKYAQVAFFSCIGSPFGYASLKHIDYPTMILGKSCKLVPVMLMNILIYRRRFPPYKYICVAMITAGVSLFMLYHHHHHENDKGTGVNNSNSMWGLFLLGTNLVIDGLTNATQDQIFRTHPTIVSGQHMMFYMNSISSLFSAGYLVLHPYNDELRLALQFCAAHPAVIRDILLFGLCGALGQCFIFYTLQFYGSLRLVTVTVTRKLFTMLLSVFWFDHVLSFGQWCGAVLVFAAIGLEAYIKKIKST
ncbi:unnamed protein product [Absidia cylindrospora]